MKSDSSMQVGMSVRDRVRSIRWLSIVAVAVLVIIADQLSKQIVLAYFQPGQVLPVLEGFFNLVLVFNYGAAFGIFGGISDGLRELVLALSTLIALGVVGALLIYDYYADRLGQLALALILGGAIGNIIDRLMHGAVVDFLDFYIGTNHWPAFNIADSAICIGVALVMMRRLF